MRQLSPVEIIVLIVIAAIGLAVAVPWLLQSRDTSRVVQCQANLNQLAKGMNAFQKVDGGRMPFGTVRGSPLPPEKRLAWTVTLYSALYSDAKTNFDPAIAWDRDPNRDPTLGGRSIRRNPLFRCPADTIDSPPDQLQFSSYVGMAGVGADAAKLTAVTPAAGFWGYDRQTRLSQITDGARHAICILESSRDNGAWTAGGRPTIRELLPKQAPYLGPGRQFGGHHPGECEALMADGSVRRLSNSISSDVFERLCTIAGERVAPTPKQ